MNPMSYMEATDRSVPRALTRARSSEWIQGGTSPGNDERYAFRLYTALRLGYQANRGGRECARGTG
jgi:hypothetical protein